MNRPPETLFRLEAETRTAIGSVRLSSYFSNAPIDRIGAPDMHHLELALMRVNAFGCFPERWGAKRFEPIGSLFLFPAGQLVHSKAAPIDQASIVCSFEPESLLDWFDGTVEWTDQRLQCGLDIGNATIRDLVWRIGQEVRHPGFAGDALIELLSAQIAIELVRHCVGIEDAGDAPGGLATWRLRVIDDRLAAPGPSPSLAELAALCTLSVRQLARGFRASRGRSIGAHIAECRIEQAKRLLASDHGIKQIVHRLGFSTPANFTTAFRRATGDTPRQYRLSSSARS